MFLGNKFGQQDLIRIDLFLVKFLKLESEILKHKVEK